MRRFALLPLAAAVASLAAAAAPPAAAATPKLTAEPDPVRFGEALEIRGRGWPVFETCSRRVRLALESEQNAFRIAVVRVGDRGRFRETWTPRRAKVGAGTWRLVGRMRCESGDDGSRFTVKRAVRVRIR